MNFSDYRQEIATHKSDFNWFKSQIADNDLGYVKTGLICMYLQENNRYKFITKHKTFKEVCKYEFKKSNNYIEKCTRATRVVLILTKLGFTTLPQNEAQCRVLTAYLPDNPLMDTKQETLEQFKYLWQLVLNKLKKEHLTASKIWDIIQPDENPYKTVQLPQKSLDRLKELQSQIGSVAGQIKDDSYWLSLMIDCIKPTIYHDGIEFDSKKFNSKFSHYECPDHCIIDDTGSE